MGKASTKDKEENDVEYHHKNRSQLNNLKVFYVDEIAPKSPVFLSFDSPNHVNELIFDINRKFEDLSKEENYEVLPVSVIHQIYCFLRPKDLARVFCCCKYFYKIGSSNKFWKDYYYAFYYRTKKGSVKFSRSGMMMKKRKKIIKTLSMDSESDSDSEDSEDSDSDDSEEEEGENEEDSDSADSSTGSEEEDGKVGIEDFDEKNRKLGEEIVEVDEKTYKEINWKKQFFKRYPTCHFADKYYRGKIKPRFLYFNDPFQVKIIRKRWRRLNYRLQVMQKKVDDYVEIDPEESKAFMYVHGPEGVGKRSLVHRLVKNKFPLDVKEVDPRKALIRFKGMSLVKTCTVYVSDDVPKMDMSERASSSNIYGVVSIFCFALDDMESFKALDKYYWSVLMKFYGKNERAVKLDRKEGKKYPFVLVGMKSDVPSMNREVKRKDIRRFIKEKRFKAYVECSAKSNSSCFLPFAAAFEKKVSLSRLSERLNELENIAINIGDMLGESDLTLREERLVCVK